MNRQDAKDAKNDARNERASGIDPRALVARLNAEAAALRGREILAPLPPGGRVRTRLGGLVYEFAARGQFVGWGRFRPLDERTVAPVGPALPWQRAAYLELFPALRVILLWPDPAPRRSGLWWALPFNESDAQQRFRLDGTAPLPVLLCDPTDGADRCERVIARVEGGTLWYDGPDPMADPIQAAWLRAATDQPAPPTTWLAGLASSQRLAVLYGHLRALDQTTPALPPSASGRDRAAWLRQRATRATLQERFRRALARADAVLHSYQELPDADGQPGPLLVEWSDRGQTRRYRSTVDRDLAVVASGICLSDRDGDFDLTSLVSVMRESPWS